ncbi:hypothetical protein [Desulfovibrio sp. JC010]|uniref:hypothetical protein n=1 Tax=Desulfovibrio sp. JC010 TaxID=2593641 RepID=UPI0013D21212|nr:hypothetical protein [Desulfovibrio sp. JC010]NDV28693.1 hypothetical protein [Desulfovibrio sp. JC010]
MKGKLLRAVMLAFVLGTGFFLGTIYGNQGQAAGTVNVKTIFSSPQHIRMEITSPVPITKTNRHSFMQMSSNKWLLGIWYNQ